MKTEKEKTYELKLTEQQKAELQELTGKQGDVLTFTIDELEERIAPRLAGN
jgi:hypothetical protein